MTSFIRATDAIDPAVGLTAGADLLRVVADPIMGRCLVATRNLQAGELLYIEDAFIYAQFEELCDQRVNKALLMRAFGKKVFKQLDDLEEEFAAFESVQSLDTSRSWFQFVALLILRDEIEASTSTENENIAKWLHLALQLTPGPNYSTCVAHVKHFRELHRTCIPARISSEECGHLLGLLNTNQVELENLPGSGLFPTTAILEHCCAFNCSYTTEGNKLYMTATKNIAAGTRLSIDYVNGYYTSTAARRETLLESYGFQCICEKCTGIDTTRSFCAPSRESSLTTTPDADVIQSIASLIQSQSVLTRCCMNSDGSSVYVCESSPPGASSPLTCDSSFIVTCLEREAYYESNPPASVEELKAMLTEGIVHVTHHIVFQAVNEQALELSDRARSAASREGDKGGGKRPGAATSKEIYARALVLMQCCCQLLQMHLPAVHHEKVIFYDRLGQIAVCAGDAKLAKSAYTEAYRQSCLASSHACPATAKIKLLMETTPTTLQELLRHYGAD